MENIEKLKNIINKSKNIVFFGGAGVSTESGIPDFRSVDGLYNQNYAYPPEEILSHDFFFSNTKEFYRFYREKILVKAEPNPAHYALCKLEKDGKLSAVVTQNIDGLHQKAGSKTVYELHGSVLKNTCVKCGKHFPLKYIEETDGVPHCSCGGIIKPDVVLYGEPLNEPTVLGAVNSIARADTLIVAGTSLAVYPAASFINYFEGENLILINKTKTINRIPTTLEIYGKVGEILKTVTDI